MMRRAQIDTYVKAFWWWNRRQVRLDIIGTIDGKDYPIPVVRVKVKGRDREIRVRDDGLLIQLNGGWVKVPVKYSDIVNAVGQMTEDQIKAKVGDSNSWEY